MGSSAMKRGIVGITAPGRTDLAVLKPYRPRTIGPDPMLLTRWVANLPVWTPFALLAVALLWPVLAHAQGKYGYADATEALWRWLPFLVFVHQLLDFAEDLDYVMFEKDVRREIGAWREKEKDVLHLP